MSQPMWRNHLESSKSSRLFNGSLRGGGDTGLCRESHRVGWLALLFRKEWPSTLPSPPSVSLLLPADSLLASAGENDAWRGWGRGQALREGFLDVLLLRKEILKAGKKSGKSRAWLFELFI